MEWLWLVVAASLMLYVWQRFRSPNTKAAALSGAALNMASDRELMIATFRRELANYLMRNDPDRFLRLYRKAIAAEEAIKKADKDEREAELIIVTKKYPLYQDFDLIGTREHVLYSDALSMYPLEDIEVHYLNLVKFHALQRVLNDHWQFRGQATSEEDLKHLQSYVQKIKDTRFRQRLIRAVGEFFAQRRTDVYGLPEGQVLYETDTIAVFHVPHFMESRYAFQFKDTNEFGLYSSFYDDDRDKNYQSFYRTDRRFQHETHLDHLHIDELI
jgi:hypothetical protein